MQVMQIEYRIQKDSIVAEIKSAPDWNGGTRITMYQAVKFLQIKLTFCGACIWITKLVHRVRIFEFLETSGA